MEGCSHSCRIGAAGAGVNGLGRDVVEHAAPQHFAILLDERQLAAVIDRPRADGHEQRHPEQPEEAEVLHRLGELAKVDRFAHVGVGAARVAANDVLVLFRGGEDHDGQVTGALLGADAAEDLVAVDTRQVEVEEDEARARGGLRLPCAVQVFQRLHAVVGHHDLIEDVALLQRAEGEELVVLVVFHEQDQSAVHDPSPPTGASASVNRKVAPSPTTPSAQIRPPWRRTIRCTVARPMPVPGNSRGECSRLNGANNLSA